MATTADDVTWMLALIAAHGAEAVVAGGWGVDALVGTATRPHRDLDVLVPEAAVARLTDALIGHGFVVTTDELPVRVELTDRHRDRRIDIHPAIDDGDGGYWQHGVGDDRYATPARAITTGVIGDRTVRCFTAEHQLAVHQGYEPTAIDLADIAELYRLVT